MVALSPVRDPRHPMQPDPITFGSLESCVGISVQNLVECLRNSGVNLERLRDVLGRLVS